MAAGRLVVEKKLFTVSQANATLPLVRAIVQDITELANNLRERQDRLSRLQPPKGSAVAPAYREELQQAEAEFERDQERLIEFARELKDLGVELKDYYTGLIDFPCWLDDREVYLCWRLGEPEIGFWHELDAGVAGRKKLTARMSKK